MLSVYDTVQWHTVIRPTRTQYNTVNRCLSVSAWLWLMMYCNTVTVRAWDLWYISRHVFFVYSKVDFWCRGWSGGSDVIVRWSHVTCDVTTDTVDDRQQTVNTWVRVQFIHSSSNTSLLCLIAYTTDVISSLNSWYNVVFVQLLTQLIWLRWTAIVSRHKVSSQCCWML